jgi:amidase
MCSIGERPEATPNEGVAQKRGREQTSAMRRRPFVTPTLVALLGLASSGCDASSMGNSAGPESPGVAPADGESAPLVNGTPGEPSSAAPASPTENTPAESGGGDIRLDPLPSSAPNEGGEGDPETEVAPAPLEPSQLALLEATLGELRRALATRLVTPSKLTEMYLARVAAFDADGPELNAFLQLSDHALADANALGTRCEDPGAPPLCGIPVVLKDNIDTADLPTTAGSLALEGSLPAQDAFVTRRLREAGAVIIGKATLTELANFLGTAMPSGYSSLGGFGFNPYDPRPLPGGDGRPVLTPGGSSSGSAIAVSANLAALGVGTETAGSILSPASSNGIVGIKPTLGLVSRAGIIPISVDQDTAGPLARTVRDAAVLLGVLAGFDEADPATSACLQPGTCLSDYAQFLDSSALAGARIAAPPFPNGRGGVMEAATSVLEARGASVVQIAPLPQQRGTCTSVPAPGNCSTVLIYGFKRDLNAYLAATPAAPVGSLAELIAFNAATDGALAYGQQLASAADALDVSPGSGDTLRYQNDRATALGGARSALDAVYRGPDGVAGTDDDIDALLFSENSGAGAPAIAGYPSITVPGGFLPPSNGTENEFPSGVTFSGPAFSEPRLIALAFAFEQATLLREPPASTPALPSDTVVR